MTISYSGLLFWATLYFSFDCRTFRCLIHGRFQHEKGLFYDSLTTTAPISSTPKSYFGCFPSDPRLPTWPQESLSLDGIEICRCADELCFSLFFVSWR